MAIHDYQESTFPLCNSIITIIIINNDDDDHLKKDKLFDSIELLIVIDQAHPLPVVLDLDLIIIIIVRC